MMVPMIIRVSAFQYSMLNRKATVEPETAPLPGRGIATNSNTNSSPYFSNFLLCFALVFSNILSIKCLKRVDFLLRYFVIGPIKARFNAAGIIVPDIAKKSVLVIDRPSSLPRGIASFISTNGVSADKNVVSSGRMLVSLYFLRYFAR